jgi:hypothetical protein
MLHPRPLHSPGTAMLWPSTEADVIIKTVVVVALCQNLIRQMPCQDAGQGYALSYDLLFKRLLLDSRVVDLPMASNLTLVMLSSLKSLLFNSLKNESRFSDTVGA